MLCVLQALSGFLMMMTQNGKLLYISDNAAEYLGHSMVSTRLSVHCTRFILQTNMYMI